MICYKDQTYCGSNVEKHTCDREFTEQDTKDAEIWWGGKDYPVAFGNFCDIKDPFTDEEVAGEQKEQEKNTCTSCEG